MGLSAGIGSVIVIVTDVLDLFEVCLQNLDISINEWAIIFFLAKIDPCVIGGSHFGWSFHNRVSVLFDFVPSEAGGSVEIDFSFQNGKLRTVRSEGIQWKTGRNVDMFFVSAVL